MKDQTLMFSICVQTNLYIEYVTGSGKSRRKSRIIKQQKLA